jgi:hypothetical protein
MIYLVIRFVPNYETFAGAIGKTEIIRFVGSSEHTVIQKKGRYGIEKIIFARAGRRMY